MLICVAVFIFSFVAMPTSALAPKLIDTNAYSKILEQRSAHSRIVDDIGLEEVLLERMLERDEEREDVELEEILEEMDVVRRQERLPDTLDSLQWILRR
jgi:hypothetical protein